jgi:acyl dehydratase
MKAHTLYGEDLEIGESFFSDAMTVTESHVITFAGLSGDMNPLHMDRQWAETQGPYGERIAHGVLGLTIASGLRCKLDDLALIGFLGIEDWRFRRPIKFGDTIRCSMILSELSPTSKPGRSLLKVGVEVLNQTDEVVQSGTWIMMILDNPEAS